LINILGFAFAKNVIHTITKRNLCNFQSKINLAGQRQDQVTLDLMKPHKITADHIFCYSHSKIHHNIEVDL